MFHLEVMRIGDKYLVTDLKMAAYDCLLSIFQTGHNIPTVNPLSVKTHFELLQSAPLHQDETVSIEGVVAATTL